MSTERMSPMTGMPVKWGVEVAWVLGMARYYTPGHPGRVTTILFKETALAMFRSPGLQYLDVPMNISGKGWEI